MALSRKEFVPLRTQVKTSLLLVSLFLALTSLTGCPKRVNAGNPKSSNLGSVSNQWGNPNNRTSTAGFNGSPSQMNDAGPSLGERLPTTTADKK